MKISRKALPLRKAIWCDLWHFRLRIGADPVQTHLVGENGFTLRLKIIHLEVPCGWSLAADMAKFVCDEATYARRLMWAQLGSIGSLRRWLVADYQECGMAETVSGREVFASYSEDN